MDRAVPPAKDRPSARSVPALAALAVLTAAGAALAQTALAQTAAAPPAPPPSAAPAPSTAPAPAAPPAVVLPPEEAPPPEALPPAPAEAAVEAPAPKPEAKAPAVPEPPAKRARYDVAVLQALDKITAETVRFEAAVGKPVRYKSLVFTVRACERSTDEEATPDAIAYMTIESQPKAAPGKPTPAARQAFRGWMFASSPGLNPLEHPVYDAWLITCRAAAPS